MKDGYDSADSDDSTSSRNSIKSFASLRSNATNRSSLSTRTDINSRRSNRRTDEIAEEIFLTDAEKEKALKDYKKTLPPFHLDNLKFACTKDRIYKKLLWKLVN